MDKTQTNEKARKTAEDVLAAVGGKENVTVAAHCMTRLRFGLRDESAPDLETIKKIPGVLSAIRSGGQLQVIIGQNVKDVYACLCEIGGFKQEAAIDENPDGGASGKGAKKWTARAVGGAILDGWAGCLVPLIPLLMAVCVFKMLTALLGSSMLGVLDEQGNLFKLLTFVGDAGFYFLPIFTGFTAAKKFGATPLLGMFMGAILIHPVFLGLAAERAEFSVFGIPCTPQNYTSTVIPAILSVWILSYIERFWRKVLPKVLQTVFAPGLSILIMLPLSLCVLSPAGGFVGQYFTSALLGVAEFGGIFGIIGIALIGALWEFLVMSGMHIIAIASMITVFSTTGVESVVNPGAICASIAVSGMALGAALRLRNKEARGLGFSYLIAGIVGGITEPALYGIGMKYKRPFIGLLAGGFAGAFYAGITGATTYALIPVANFICILGFAGGSTANFVNGAVAGVISFVTACVVTYLFGFSKNEADVKRSV